MTPRDTRSPRPHVVVIGGGFGGLEAVRSLKDADVDVTLVDRHAYNTFQPLLYQVATAGLNPGDITYFLRSLSAKQKNMRFRKATVERIDTAGQTVFTDSGAPIDYDYLVIASGVTTNYFGILGAAEHSLALYTRSQALDVRDTMFAMLEKAAVDGTSRDLNVVVVGGGATGVETAGAFAELRNMAIGKVYPELDPERTHIILLEMADHVLAPFAPKLRKYAAKALTARGVELRLGKAVKEVRADGVVIGDDEEFVPAGLVVWATGITAPDAVAHWGVPQGQGGRILVRPDLRVEGLDAVFAIGDISLGPDPLPQLAQPALQGGNHVGNQIRALLAGEGTTAFRYKDKGILATIGRSAAVAQIKHAPKMTGFPAWAIWIAIHIVTLLSNRNRLATMVNLSVRYLSWPRSFNAIVGEVPTPRD